MVADEMDSLARLISYHLFFAWRLLNSLDQWAYLQWTIQMRKRVPKWQPQRNTGTGGSFELKWKVVKEMMDQGKPSVRNIKKVPRVVSEVDGKGSWISLDAITAAARGCSCFQG